MKLITILAIAFFSVGSFAADDEADVVRPYLVKTVGNPKGEKPSYVACLVIVGKTITIEVVEGKKKPAVAKENTVKVEAFAKLVTEVSKAKIINAVHIKETVPNVKITAGLAQNKDVALRNFLVKYDASGFDYREGASAEELIKLADDNCGKLKPANEAREE